MSVRYDGPILDGHNDVLLQLWRSGTPIADFLEEQTNHIDLSRALDVGLGVGLFAIYVPNEERVKRTETADGYGYPVPDALDTDRAKRVTHELLALLCRLAAECDQFHVIRTATDLADCLAGDDLGAVVHLEGAAAVEPDRSNLDFLYAAGVRSIGPVWSRPNAFGHGVRARYPGGPDTGSGLTEAGRGLVRACNKKGILVDCAHMNEREFWETADLTDAPLVVSHTGAHAVCPHSRNLTDEQLDAVANTDGLVGITFCTNSLRANTDPTADASIDALADHVEYVADRVGIEHVALGSDLDGAQIPTDIGDVTGIRAVIETIRERGFNACDIEQFASDNWQRVLEGVFRK